MHEAGRNAIGICNFVSYMQTNLCSRALQCESKSGKAQGFWYASTRLLGLLQNRTKQLSYWGRASCEQVESCTFAGG